MPASYTTLPYSSHPLYKLRLATLITVLIGAILDFVSIFTIAFFVVSLFILACSAFFIFYDLLTYAVEKKCAAFENAHRSFTKAVQHLRQTGHECGCGFSDCPRGQSSPPSHGDLANPTSSHAVPTQRAHDGNGSNDDDDDDDDDQKPNWPRLILLILDAALAILFQLFFWVLLINIINRHSSYPPYYPYPASLLIWQSYGALANLFLSVLHAVAWWKELMARKKRQWEEEERKKTREGRRVTALGGERDLDVGGVVRGGGKFERWVKIPFGRKGDKGGEEEGDIEAAAVSGSASSEEELLVAPTPGESPVSRSSDKGYGTLDASVQSLGGEPDVVVKKNKGKRIVGKGWAGGNDAVAT